MSKQITRPAKIVTLWSGSLAIDGGEYGIGDIIKSPTYLDGAEYVTPRYRVGRAVVRGTALRYVRVLPALREPK